jgi:hypothetical protein
LAALNPPFGRNPGKGKEEKKMEEIRVQIARIAKVDAFYEGRDYLIGEKGIATCDKWPSGNWSLGTIHLDNGRKLCFYKVLLKKLSSL